MSNTETQFLAAIIESGLPPPDSFVADGEMHRFASNGNAGDLAGWYVLHADCIPATGMFGCWRGGVKVKSGGCSYARRKYTELRHRSAG
jgi:hypothetical protein